MNHAPSDDATASNPKGTTAGLVQLGVLGQDVG